MRTDLGSSELSNGDLRVQGYTLVSNIERISPVDAVMRASDARGDQGEDERASPGPLDLLGLRRFLIEEGLQHHCYINRIAINYRRDDRPSKGLERWLERLFFLERFIDEDGKDCVRVRDHPIG